VLLAAWAAIFLVDFFRFRREGYDERALYEPTGRYGSVNLAGVIAFLVAGFVGLGLVVSTASVFRWAGYLLWLPGFGGKEGAIALSSIGVFIAFLVAGVLYLVLAPRMRPETVAS
jgi:cytosine/uracil/thiamine/allantoin permease